MNELVLKKEQLEALPGLAAGVAKALHLLQSVRNWKDVTNLLLRGDGLSPASYRSYVSYIKEYYRYTGGLNPLQTQKGHVAGFYDSVAKRLNANSAAFAVCALKRFFRGCEELCPGFESPFRRMPEKLLKKMSKAKKRKTRKALTISEIKKLLTWLAEDKTIRGMRDHSLIYFLVSSGLRVGEALGLTWADVEQDPDSGALRCYFSGKGDQGKDSSQEVYAPALKACRDYFRRQFRRDPKPEDWLFWTVPERRGYKPRQLYAVKAWQAIKEIGERARYSGIVTRELCWSPHLFRRSYASALYKSGMGLKAIQQKTRHASISTLTEHYIDDEQAAAPYLAKAFA